MDFDVDSLINGGLAFAAVLSLMILNVPVGISMLFVGFVGFALISGFDPAIVVLGFAPYEAVSKYSANKVSGKSLSERVVHLSLVILTSSDVFKTKTKKCPL